MVSIIILSYNTKDLLKDCVESVFSHVKNISHEVIIVDNASTDGSVDMIKKQFKGVKLIENKDNLGFTKGCNLGAKNAKGEFLLFLNSDTLLQDESPGHMISFLKENSKVGVVGGRLENPDHSSQRSYGDFYTLSNIFLFLFGGFGKDRGELLIQKKDTRSSVDWVNGGFMLVRREVFQKVKGFDENIFMYTEDMELCFRIKKAGYDVYYDPAASVIHKGQGSSNRTFAVVNIYKGLLYFYKTHKSKFEYIIVKGMLLVKAYISLLIGIITNNSYLKKTYKQALSI